MHRIAITLIHHTNLTFPTPKKLKPDRSKTKIPPKKSENSENRTVEKYLTADPESSLGAYTHRLLLPTVCLGERTGPRKWVISFCFIAACCNWKERALAGEVLRALTSRYTIAAHAQAVRCDPVRLRHAPRLLVVTPNFLGRLYVCRAVFWVFSWVSVGICGFCLLK